MILVTGATGLVGSHLLVQLLQKNEVVKALFRCEKQLEKVKNVFAFHHQSILFDKINWIKGDITDISSLEIAFENITHVYHCAALISFDPNDEEELRKTNIEGTANIVNCCIDFGVKKLCHVSSVAALGNPKEHETTITEQTEWNAEEFHSDYAITKYGAEMEVFRGFNEGLDVVIVNPGVIFGYGFSNQGSGKIIQTVKTGMLFYTKGSIGIVAVEDVVLCMIQLMNSNTSGERYILVGENCSIKELIHYLALLVKVKPPSIYASKMLINWGWKIDWFSSKIFNQKRKFTKSVAKSLHAEALYSNKKICSLLDFVFQKKEGYLTDSL